MKKKVPIAAEGQANVSAETGHLFLDCEGYGMVEDQIVFEKVGKTEKIIGYYLVFSKHFRTVYKERLPISVPKVKLWT